MNEYYTPKEAMELLGMKSTNAFLQLVRKYPDAFVNVNQTKQRDKNPWYEKATLDKFAQMREYFKHGKP
jgi:ferric iron reductase protein FhuF